LFAAAMEAGSFFSEEQDTRDSSVMATNQFLGMIRL